MRRACHCLVPYCRSIGLCKGGLNLIPEKLPMERAMGIEPASPIPTPHIYGETSVSPPMSFDPLDIRPRKRAARPRRTVSHESW